MDRLLVVALGNPGDEYVFTRHNAGWMLADYIAYREKLKFRPGKGEFWVAESDSSPFILFKPTTYMNNSGVAVVQIVSLYRVEQLNELVVAVDDTALPVGRMRFRLKGSDGGHNGLKSIIYHLGTQEFPRLRLGIGSPPDGMPLRDYVLSEFPDDEFETLREAFPTAYQGLIHYLRGDVDLAMQTINSYRPQN